MKIDSRHEIRQLLKRVFSCEQALLPRQKFFSRIELDFTLSIIYLHGLNTVEGIPWKLNCTQVDTRGQIRSP
jgi:hypothetical protein